MKTNERPSSRAMTDVWEREVGELPSLLLTITGLQAP